MFKTIALALDGSEASERAVSAAADLAQQDHAKIVVVHVEEDVAGKGWSGPVHLDEDEIQAKIRKQAEELANQGIDTSVEMRRTILGGPAAVITEVAEEAGADVIVTGSRGRSLIPGLLVGSVASRLLHLAHRPVLVIPPPQS